MSVECTRTEEEVRRNERALLAGRTGIDLALLEEFESAPLGACLIFSLRDGHCSVLLDSSPTMKGGEVRIDTRKTRLAGEMAFSLVISRMGSPSRGYPERTCCYYGGDPWPWDVYWTVVGFLLTDWTFFATRYLTRRSPGGCLSFQPTRAWRMTQGRKGKIEEWLKKLGQ